jgi:hypothetical protein
VFTSSRECVYYCCTVIKVKSRITSSRNNEKTDSWTCAEVPKIFSEVQKRVFRVSRRLDSFDNKASTVLFVVEVVGPSMMCPCGVKRLVQHRERINLLSSYLLPTEQKEVHQARTSISAQVLSALEKATTTISDKEELVGGQLTEN